MADKVVVLRVGEHLLSLPFIHVDEILSPDRAVAASDLPEGTVPDSAVGTLFVSSRGRWLGIRELLAGQGKSERSQIVVVTCDESTKALMVDQVVGIEKAGVLASFPEVVVPFMDIPFAGVRFLKDQPVLELDLSRLFSLDRGD
jgi:chemotaxis signal transduction protein